MQMVQVDNRQNDKELSVISAAAFTCQKLYYN